jgi:biotin synthase-like enzyme
MIYEVVNKPKKIDEVLLDRAVSFAADFLELDVDLLISFQSLKKHQCGFCDYSCDYSCDFDEDEVIITIAKRLSLREMIVTLFHEMIHVQQYVSGRLEHGSKWLGKVYECVYSELPWEVEAHEMEKEMMAKFGDLK